MNNNTQQPQDVNDKTFVFTYYIIGRGPDQDEALTDALESFVVDPGEPDNVRECQEDDV